MDLFGLSADSTDEAKRSESESYASRLNIKTDVWLEMTNVSSKISKILKRTYISPLSPVGEAISAIQAVHYKSY